VLHALRRFCQLHQEWVVLRKDENNHGLIVLSKRPEDVKQTPNLLRKALNYAKAKAKHVAAGLPIVSDRVLELRQAECALCPERAMDACAPCGCPLEAKLPLATETCGMAKVGKEPKWLPVTDATDLRSRT
jgi:hypothetical protein